MIAQQGGYQVKMPSGLTIPCPSCMGCVNVAIATLPCCNGTMVDIGGKTYQSLHRGHCDILWLERAALASARAREELRWR